MKLTPKSYKYMLDL